ncbi:MAG: hypothetical protein IJZ94_04785 [Clostridia bacterium]|nr:hypothetical protein [Clostridia bacterium]
MFLTLLLVFAVLFFSVLIYRAKDNNNVFGAKVVGWFQQNRTQFIFGFVAVLIPTVVFCTILSTRTMPVAEGWYSVYAKLINNGSSPYTDFELLFMPLYTYLISGITAIFGYDIIVLRVFGIIVFAAITLLTYNILSKIFKPWISAVATIVAAFYLQSEIVQIFYDYIRIFDLCAYAATLLLLCHVSKVLSSEEVPAFSWQLVLSGVIAMCSFLVRQNSGAFVLVYTFAVLVFIAIYFRKTKNHIFHIIEYIVAALVPLLITVLVMVSNGSLKVFLDSTVGGAIESKGGMLTVLFAWVPRMLSAIWSKMPWFLLGLFIIFASVYAEKRFSIQKDRTVINSIIFISFPVLILVGIVVCWHSFGISRFFSKLIIGKMPYLFFGLSFIIFIAVFIWLIKHRHDDKAELKPLFLVFTLSGMIIALAYGCATSSGIVEGQSALAVGLFLCIVLHFSNHKFGYINRAVALLFATVMCFQIISAKYRLPYSWWSLTEGDLRYATETVDIPELKGIKVSAETKDGYERIVSMINEYSDEDDTVFVFPHAPIFYLLADNYPSTYTIVQWFDVASDESVIADISNLQENKPAVIVHFRIPDNVVESHESLFRSDDISGLHKMTDALDTMVADDYTMIDSLVMQNYNVEIYALK